MRMVKSLLLGSAAGIVAIAGAQAADLPVKAKPVEYVKVCTLYGAGFWYVPGTNTCMKVGMYIRNQLEWEANGGFIYRSGATGRYTRTESPGLEHRVRGVVTVDTRTQTDYGTLRGYVRVGGEQTNPNEPDQEVYFDRAFIQFGGLTVGRADSFFDFFSLARYNYINNFFSSNMGATGQFVLGYTFQFGGGWSASIAIEDGGASAAGAAGNNTRSRGKSTVDLNSGTLFGSAVGTVVDNGAYAMPDIVANIRVDQAWGSAQIMGALHQNRGGYYGSAIACPFGTPNTDTCTYPTDQIGWAVGAGVVLNNLWAPGSSISAQFNYGEGAIGYILRGTGAWVMYGNGRSVGFGAAVDSVFGCSDTLGGVAGVGGAPGCTGLELTRAWGITAGAEHRWNPQWRTSIYGGYVDVDYGSGATSLICSTAVPLGVAGVTPVPGTTLNCNPDFQLWGIGTRTQWNPHPYLDIGIDVFYTRLETAFAGTAVVAGGGARTAGTYQIEDQDRLGVFGRIQYNFLP